MKQILQFIIPIMLLGNVAFAQDVIQGVIKDADGQPLVGATIQIGERLSPMPDREGRRPLAPEQHGESHAPAAFDQRVRASGNRSRTSTVSSSRSSKSIAFAAYSRCW